MAERIAAGRAFPQAVVRQVLDRANGVPLFIEELTKTILDNDELRDGGETNGLAELPIAIPETLQDALMERLDRLSPVKEVAFTGAVIGRGFSYDLLAAVMRRPERDLIEALNQLVDAEIIVRRGDTDPPSSATYAFKHALLQEAAYETLLRSRRRELHARVAAVLETEFADVTRDQPEMLARHYAAARLNAKAIDYYLQAAEKASATSANVEAIGHLSKGLELLDGLSDSDERARRELQLCIALGAPYTNTRGWSAPEVEATYARAMELCEDAGETPELFRTLMGLWVFHLVRAKLATAQELSQRLLEVAARFGHPGLAMSSAITEWKYKWASQLAA